MLTEAEKNKILSIIKKGKNDARTICRANALNLRSKGYTLAEVADILEITPRTVFNIECYFEQGGLERALYDDPRPGPAPEFDDRVKSQIVAIVCSEPPEAFDRWTLDLIVERAVKDKVVNSISRETVRVILREHDLKPWQQKSWCVPDLDEEFIERMEDVLNVYEQEDDSDCPLVCLDEKPIQLLDDVRPSSGVTPGEIKKVDFEYKRKGTANVFCAVLPKEGVYINRVTENRKGKEFAKFLASIERRFPDAEKIKLVMDNLNTHSLKSLTNYYGEKEGGRIWNRFEIHFTPKHGSWLNQAEIAINMYSRQCLGKSRIPDIDLLRKKTKAWNRIVNQRQVKIQWRFTRKDAQEKFGYT
jgi:transposase